MRDLLRKLLPLLWLGGRWLLKRFQQEEEISLWAVTPRMITETANRLQVSEEELFDIAYFEYHGERIPLAPHKDYSEYFDQGTLKGPIPLYVQHFIRKHTEVTA